MPLIYHRRYLFQLLFAIMFLFGSANLSGQTLQVNEYQLKAAFLYNFTQFVQWAPASFSNSSSPFVIGILGEDPFGLVIDELIAGEKVEGHPIIVERYPRLNSQTNCHILFISKQSIINLEDLKDLLPSKNTLTVSDVPNFAKQGGMIRLMIEGNKTKMQINLSAARAADVKISSKLLSLAEVIQEPR